MIRLRYVQVSLFAILGFTAGITAGLIVGSKYAPHATIERDWQQAHPIQEAMVYFGGTPDRGLMLTYLNFDGNKEPHYPWQDYCDGTTNKDPRWHLKLSGETGKVIWHECWNHQDLAWELPRIDGIRATGKVANETHEQTQHPAAE